ncbi:hypothetical protein [Plantactinospora sp. B5E13]|uniref:hypothetical protein n=1 Tax=Plantactinospora sp. B5E13 TaxID=3153758 RepID=UPI00325CB2A8
MPDQPVFSDPWWDLRRDGPAEQAQRRALHAQLFSEIAPGHPLHGQPVEVVARSKASDDIVVQTAGRWAIVHLTWENAIQTPPWPVTCLYESASDFVRKLPEPG